MHAPNDDIKNAEDQEVAYTAQKPTGQETILSADAEEQCLPQIAQSYGQTSRGEGERW